MELERYMEQYGDYLYRIAYMYTKDRQAAEEVVQDVFMKLYETQQFEGKSSEKTYLTKMTINRSYDYLRKWKAKKAQLVEYFGGENTVQSSMLLQGKSVMRLSRRF